jgi:hypothetical protein
VKDGFHILVERQDIHEYVSSLWKTDIFRDEHDRHNGVIRKLVEQFAYVPRVFAHSSNDHLERSHFSTWWNVIMLRDDYENPYVSDLYYAHEIFHAANMPYLPGIGKVAFDEKMQRNELEASTFSEIELYFQMPGLRERSFPYPIYADRFLEDEAIRILWSKNREVAVETLRTIRRDVMMSKPEHTMDLTERWIRRFAEQNAIYSITWSDRYGEVEQHMHDFTLAALEDRQTGADMHVNWLKKEAGKDPVDFIPFRREAELFAGFYWSNKEKYAEAMHTAGAM